MTRFMLVMLGLAIAGATGCAQCDTCDDFPAPCVGPNCGQNGFATNSFIPPTQDGMPYNPAMSTSAPSGNRPEVNNGMETNPLNVQSPTNPPSTNPAGDSPPLPTTP